MKTMIIGIAAALTMMASMSVLANVHNHECAAHQHSDDTQVTIQGARCRGTVGCDCPGFSPITNGDLWQQAYCKHCGHRRMYH